MVFLFYVLYDRLIKRKGYSAIKKNIHYSCYSYTLSASPVSHPFLCQLCGKLLR